MKRIFQNVIWPAIAGNVAWAFFTVLVEANWLDHAFLARLLSLLAVATYLATDWHATDISLEKINPQYWIADAFLAPAIALFAISVQSKSGWEPYAIEMTFVVAIIGHLFGSWDETERGTSSWPNRLKLVAINSIGLVLLFAGTVLPQRFQVYSIPAAIIVVVVLYIYYLRKNRQSNLETSL